MHALMTIQQNLIADQGLALPCKKGYSTIDTDECDKQIGSVLRQGRPRRAKELHNIVLEGLTLHEKTTTRHIVNV